MRFFTQLSYNGSSYHGWQFQKNTISTVQGVLESALHTIGRKRIPIVGCGRTDAGVHASDYYFHFDDDSDWQGKEYKLNSLLPKDIAIKKINLVHEDAHARFDATRRTYHYHLHTFKNPFSLGMSYCYKKPLDLSLLNEAASLILQTYCNQTQKRNISECRKDIYQSQPLTRMEKNNKISAARAFYRVIFTTCKISDRKLTLFMLILLVKNNYSVKSSRC